MVSFNQLNDFLVWVYLLYEVLKTFVCNINFYLFVYPRVRLEGDAIPVKSESGFFGISVVEKALSSQATTVTSK